MRFTVVTVSFNQAEFLEDTIRSILAQDYPDVEYIVVDPGSTDGSRAIIERYRDRIDKIIYRPDSGPAEGLGNGFAEASGQIYAFINSDDLMAPGAISRAAAVFEADPRTDIVTGHSRIIGPDGRWLRNSYADRFDRRAFAYRGCVFCQASTFFRADLFRQAGGFNPENKVAWDAELFLEMFALARQWALLDAFLSDFRVHAGAITGGARLRRQLHRFERRKFERIMGRPWRPADHLIALYYLARKYVLEPRSAWQRLRYGSIYGRYARPRALRR